MRKAVFLDRDGTINIDKNYLYKIDDFEYLPGVKEGLKKLCDVGFLLIIITNQSGIGRGYYTEEDYLKLNDYLISDLDACGIKITDSFYCPHINDASVNRYRVECDCRKPKTGLFYRAIEKYNIDLSSSYAIGDRVRDLMICKDTGAKGFLVYGKEEIPDGLNALAITGGILEAAELICGE